MCGITGIINFNSDPIIKQDLLKMTLAMKHRGPDDEGFFIDNNIGLGFVRLSIIDLSTSGHQPMSSHDGRYTIIFNGEIYNYLELRKELESLGVGFKSNSDTEVLLEAYIKWGNSCLNKLNGMWAFVIYDKLKKEVFGARDRYGVKPFYYYNDETKFIFASEIPPILSILKQKAIANTKSIFEYLVFNRTDQNEQTFFKGILKVKHGHFFIIKNNVVQFSEWYNLKENLKSPFNNALEYKELLADSIKLRLRSDVPIGVCFSGGIDSSAILSLLLKENEGINTFSAIYETGEIGDESRFIKLYQKLVKNMHFVKPTGESLFTDLNDLISTHAEPIPDTSPYAQYKVMQLAYKKVTVTLDGQGADEQLGGYHYFFGLYFKELFKKLKWRQLTNELISYHKIHKSYFGIKTFIYFLIPSIIKTKIQVLKKGYISNSFYNNNINNSNISTSLYSSNSLKDAFLDHFEYKLEHLLKWEDRNSMRFSIEARVPFLDYRLVERTLSLPNEQLIYKGITKVIFRDAMKDLIPEEIRMRQDKMGFGTPEADWFRKDNFKELIFKLLNSDSFINRNIIDSKRALKLYEKHLNHEIDISKEIWKWINLELWFRKFID